MHEPTSPQPPPPRRRVQQARHPRTSSHPHPQRWALPYRPWKAEGTDLPYTHILGHL